MLGTFPRVMRGLLGPISWIFDRNAQFRAPVSGRGHTGATLCGAVYFNLLEDLSFYGGFEKFRRAFSARDVFEFVRGQFVRLVR